MFSFVVLVQGHLYPQIMEWFLFMNHKQCLNNHHTRFNINWTDLYCVKSNYTSTSVFIASEEGEGKWEQKRPQRKQNKILETRGTSKICDKIFVFMDTHWGKLVLLYVVIAVPFMNNMFIIDMWQYNLLPNIHIPDLDLLWPKLMACAYGVCKT